MAAITDKEEKNAGKRTTWIQDNVLRCTTIDEERKSSLCKKDVSAGERITYDGLGLAPYSSPTTIAPDECNIAVGAAQQLVTGLPKVYLSQLASEGWVTAATLRAVLGQARMHVRPDGSWDVTYFASPIMSSSNAEYWPACSTGNSCTGQAAQFEQVFHADVSEPLNATTQTRLMWRVEGALWMIGVLTGAEPSGLISTVVPTVNFASNSAPTSVHGISVFGTGLWDEDLSQGTWSPRKPGGLVDGDFTAADAQATIGATPVGSVPFDFNIGDVSDNRSALFQEVTNAPGAFLYLPGATPAVQFPSDRVSNGGTVSDPATGLQNFITFLADATPSVVTCPRLYGEPAFAGALDWVKNTVSGLYGPAYIASDPCAPTFIATQDGVSVNDQLAECGRTDSQVTPDCALTGDAYARLRPSRCTPGQRAAYESNTTQQANNGCGDYARILDSLALGCMLATGGVDVALDQPPTLNSTNDLPLLEAWYKHAGTIAQTALSRLYMEQVPNRVVKDFKDGTVNSGSLGGAHGQSVLQLESSLQDVQGQWGHLGGLLSTIGGAIHDARINLDLNELQSEEALKTLALQRLEAYDKMAHSIANAVSAYGSGTSWNPLGGVAQSAATTFDAYVFSQELSTYDDIENIKNKENAKQILKILNDLQTSTATTFSDVGGSLSELRKATIAASSTLVALHGEESAAQYQAAKGTGADFLEIDGKRVEFPVNTVLNNQYDLTKRRYELAFREAKFLAYVAQIAIEQRIGMRLRDIKEDVAPVGTPAGWYNDLCEMTGVDYNALRSGHLPGLDSDAGVDAGASLTSFSDPYIGDYVDRFSKFMDGYNLKYPSHDGDDVALLSVRDDLLGPADTVCTRQSPNLLLYTSDMTGHDQVAAESGGPSVRGWQVSGCNAADSKCLHVAPGGALTDASPPTFSGRGGGLSWLYEVPAADILDPLDKPGARPDVPVQGVVFQAVALKANQKYALSWWDQARGGQDGAVGLAASDYQVAVYDENWHLVGAAARTFTPYVPESSGAGGAAGASGAGGAGGAAGASSGALSWAPRAISDWSVPSAGTYYVAFSAGTPGGAAGSVAISDVQLEEGAAPSGYVENHGTRLMSDTNCAAGDPEAFRRAFDYRCEGATCFYELKAPLVIDTTNLLGGDTRVVGKIAAGNFNYRHISVALNLVGTGVIDCSLEPGSACYGSSYVEYTLQHTAFDVPVLNHAGATPTFNFGEAAINHGKALAAERYITLPIGSADEGLLSAPEVSKPEFRGRPLDGSYALRIYDKPSLAWNRLEDVQIVLNYRYWSRIAPSPPSN